MSGFTTNVPSPTFGPNGVVIPSENAVLTGVQSDINTALGGGVNPQLSTPQGQLASSETAIIGDSNALFAWYCNQVDPALNEGRMQDAIARLYFITRIAGTSTIQPCICAGLDGVPIPIGALAQDSVGNIWIAEQSGNITNGSVTLNFSATAIGPIPAPITMKPYQSIPGWESITPTGAAVLGNNVETAAQFEARRQRTIASNANQILDAIQGAVLLVTGVLDAYVTENNANTTQTIGGVSINAHSIFVCVLGGSQNDIAFAIWSKKGPGCGYTGTTTVTVTDPNPNYNPPVPTYSVSFSFATIVSFVCLVTLKNNSMVPSSTALSSVQTAIVNAFAGLDGGARARIGSLVFASRYYPDIVNLGTWASQIISIQVGVLGSGASFTGSISGTTLTVSGVTGTIVAGQLLQDAGLIASGTLIVSGAGTTWTVSISQTVASEAMTTTNLVNDVQMNINQAPAISAGNVNLILQ